MADLPAVNTSPLIFLTRSNPLDLLQLTAPEIAVPAPVADEIRRRGAGDPAARALAETRWLQVVDVLAQVGDVPVGPGHEPRTDNRRRMMVAPGRPGHPVALWLPSGAVSSDAKCCKQMAYFQILRKRDKVFTCRRPLPAADGRGA